MIKEKKRKGQLKEKINQSLQGKEQKEGKRPQNHLQLKKGLN